MTNAVPDHVAKQPQARVQLLMAIANLLNTHGLHEWLPVNNSLNIIAYCFCGIQLQSLLIHTIFMFTRIIKTCTEC